MQCMTHPTDGVTLMLIHLFSLGLLNVLPETLFLGATWLMQILSNSLKSIDGGIYCISILSYSLVYNILSYHILDIYIC